MSEPSRKISESTFTKNVTRPSGDDNHIQDARSSSSALTTLVGIPAYLMRRLQSVLNAAARLIYHLRPHDHITDALATLH